MPGGACPLDNVITKPGILYMEYMVGGHCNDNICRIGKLALYRNTTIQQNKIEKSLCQDNNFTRLKCRL